MTPDEIYNEMMEAAEKHETTKTCYCIRKENGQPDTKSDVCAWYEYDLGNVGNFPARWLTIKF